MSILRLAMKVIFLRTLRNPLRSLRLRIFTAKDAKIYAKDAKKNVRLLPGEGIFRMVE